MPTTNNTTVACPVEGCEETLALHPNKPGRLLGTCACGRFPGRGVIEVDAEPAHGAEDHPLLSLPGVNGEIAGALRAIGLHTLDDVDGVSDDTLLSIPGIGPDTLEKIRIYLKER